MSRNPQLNASNYIVNIVPIQNTIANISGLNPLDVLANKVTNIQMAVMAIQLANTTDMVMAGEYKS